MAHTNIGNAKIPSFQLYQRFEIVTTLLYQCLVYFISKVKVFGYDRDEIKDGK